MEDLVRKFYDAFAKGDAETMSSCYHEEITFEDPGFGELKGKSAGDMWRMLCGQSKDLKLEYELHNCNDQEATVTWNAWYTFSRTGRPVHNIIHAKLKFKDGLIIDHRDSFDLHRWAGQALGMQGKLLGWTGFFKKKLQKSTGELLSKYQGKLS